ncbi:hypothetical protein OQA88_13678 [Cercophora sp. LCS_1]
MATNLSVYNGIWLDYSQQGVDKVVLTLPLQWGNVLISALALLVSLAGGAMWRIFAYVYHQLRVRHATRSDPFQQQVQTLLRNNGTPISAVLDSFWLCSAWAQTPYPVLKTLLPTGLVAGLIIIVFGIFSIFVSAVATQSEADVIVLARPSENCGGWEFNWAAIQVDDRKPTSFEAFRARVDDTQSARAYASWFYSRGKQPLAATNSMFPRRRLDYDISSGPCPFLGEGRCLANDTSSSNTTIIFDTGMLDSHFHLGINAPPMDRSGVRHRMACSPIDGSDMVKFVSSKGGYTTLDISAITNTTEPAVFAEKPEALSTGYSTSCRWWTGAARQLVWPENLTRKEDCDVTICYVSQNSIRYSGPIYDPLFLANGTNFSDPFYYGNNHLNFLACEQQVQFCNPVTDKCTKLTHAAEAFNESYAHLELNLNQFTAIKRSALLLGLADVGTMGLATLGASALIARESVFADTYSLHLEPDHWKKEVQLWFETKLALLQAHIMRFLDRIDKTSPVYERTLLYQAYDNMPSGPEKDAVYTNCHNMRIKTTGQYQNFRFWAVMLVILFCAGVILLSVSLGRVVSIVRGHWITREGQMRELARDLDSHYWLLRMALEGVGVGPWRRGGRKMDSSIPVMDHLQSMGSPTVGYQMDEFDKK